MSVYFQPDRLRTERVMSFMSQQELACRARITPATLSRIECGLQRPNPATIKKLARALQISPKILLGENNRDGGQ